MQEVIMKIMIGIMLLICAFEDLLYKKISIWIVAAGGVVTGIFILIMELPLLWDHLGGVLVGAIVIMISKATGGKVGMGDGLLLCVTGLGLGLWGNIELFAYALLAAAIVSIILLILRLANKKKSIPFVPFILISYVLLQVTAT